VAGRGTVMRPDGCGVADLRHLVYATSSIILLMCSRVGS